MTMLLSLPDELIRHISSPQFSELHDVRSLRLVCKRILAIVIENVHNRVAVVKFTRHPMRDIVCESDANLEYGRIRALLLHDNYERDPEAAGRYDGEYYRLYFKNTRSQVSVALSSLRRFTSLEYLSISYSTSGELPLADVRDKWMPYRQNSFLNNEFQLKSEIFFAYITNRTVTLSLFSHLTHLELIGYKLRESILARIPEGQLVELNLCIPIGDQKNSFYAAREASDIASLLKAKKHKLNSVTLSIRELTFYALSRFCAISTSLVSLSLVWMEGKYLPSRWISVTDCGREEQIKQLEDLLRTAPNLKYVSFPLCPGTLLYVPTVCGDRKFAVGELKATEKDYYKLPIVRNKIKVVESDVRRICDRIAGPRSVSKLELIGWLVPVKNYDGFKMLWCNKIAVDGKPKETSWKIGFEADFGGDPWPTSDMDSVF